MYHELTKQEIRKRTYKRMAGLFAIVLAVVLIWLASNAIGASLREQGELSVRNAILSSAAPSRGPTLRRSRTSRRTTAWL